MRGLGNHLTMIRASGEFVKEDSIKGVRLHAYCSAFPGATKGQAEDSIKGEVYRIPKSGLKNLDRLESEGYFYHRHYMTTESGDKVQVYLLKKEDVRGEHIQSGCWREYRKDFIDNERYQDLMEFMRNRQHLIRKRWSK